MGNALRFQGSRRKWLLLTPLLIGVASLLMSSASATALPAKFHGLGYSTGAESDLTHAQWSGSEYFRYPVSWTQVENSGWKPTENVFTFAKNRGITIIPVLQRATGGSAERSMPTEAQFPEWSQFVKEAVQRLGRLGSIWGGQPNSLAPIAWEVWNEPNRGENGNTAKEADPETYTRLLKVTHDAISAVDPGATVLLGGLYWNAEPGWSEGYYNLSGSLFLDKVRSYEAALYGQSGKYFDGLSLHPYGFVEEKKDENPEEEEERVERAVNRVVEAVSQARLVLNTLEGGSGKGLWITELGWPTPGVGWESGTSRWGFNEGQQEALLNKSFTQIEGMQSAYNIQSLVWYNTQDSTVASWDQHSGLVRHDGGYKKAWGTFMNHAGGGYATSTGAERWTLNGQPGWVNLEGNVTTGGGPTVNSPYFVNIDLQKYESGEWKHKEYFHPTVSSGHYVVSNYVVGTGQWRFKTYFPAQGQFRASQSEWSEFTIKAGYQLEAKHSGKCLDISNVSTANTAGVHQWECLNPAVQQNQVFTLSPQGGGYYQLVARHSGRCVDVVNASTAVGAPIQQYTCLGPNQFNQLWKLSSVTGEYFNFVAKHSGQCLDVSENLTGNGQPVHQWTCLGAGQANQLWRLRSVDSAPIPSHPSAGIPSGGLLYGQPGFVTISGTVDVGAYSLAGQWINVNYQKEVGPGNWETIAPSGHPTLDSQNNYVDPTHGVSVGNWRARAVFLGSGNIAEGVSPYTYFTVKSGYQLVSRHSGKCAAVVSNSTTNGAAILQWSCTAGTSPADGYTFTLFPKAGGYYQIRINRRTSAEISQPKCLDVIGGGTGNGVKLQQYECIENQQNQLWQKVGVSGEYVAFIAKHSGRCADVEGTSTANGALIHQWDCIWAANQQWLMRPVK